VHRYIDNFQQKLHSFFNQMVLGPAFVQLSNFVSNPKEIDITVTLARGVTSEPAPLADIIHHAAAVGAGTTELFQVRAIAAWNDLLTEIFGSFVSSHLEEKGKHSNLGQIKGQIDFSSDEPVLKQIQRTIIIDFGFLPYDKRIRTVKKLCSVQDTIDTDLKLVSQHVEIRNSLQHHNGKVTKDLLKNIGNNKLELLNPEGDKSTFTEGERILLSIPDLNELKSALYRITMKWRAGNADIPA